MRARRSDFADGVRDVIPVGVANLPFGMVAGIAAVATGLSTVQAIAMSLIVFAGASQLAALDLFGDGAVAVAILTGLIVNLRHVMYSASIAPHFRELPTRWKVACGYLLTDPAYALSVIRFRDGRGVGSGGLWYYLGSATTIWVAWQVGTVIGVAFGRTVPASWGIDFAIPLVFIALLVPSITDRATATAGVVAAVVAVLAVDVPLDLGLVTAALVGVAAGLAVESAGGDDGGAT